MTGPIHSIFKELTTRIESEYADARQHARDANPQRAGHQGESTWIRILEDWGPKLPVVSRKYIVGPEGTSNEIDIVLLKPDYPEHLRSYSTILISGVAAAFSVKLTLRRPHLAEAINQKKRLVEIAGTSNSPRDALCGPFPFVLLAHSADMFNKSDNFADALAVEYERIAHFDEPRLITSPNGELDGLLIADRAFFHTMRISLRALRNFGCRSVL